MKRFLTLLLATFFLLPVARAAEAPDAMIKRLSDEVLQLIKSDPQLQAGDMNRISRVVDDVLMPHVNFKRMTALSVGPRWREATPEQQEQLMTEFRTLLLRTYSGALSAVGDQTVRMKPFRADPSDRDVVVRSEVLLPRGGEPVQLDYRLEKAGDSWRIYDVNVIGVWLVQNYRTQFAQEVSSGGIAGLIRSLREKNQAAPAPATAAAK